MQILDTASGITVDRTGAIIGGGSGNRSGTFYVDVTGITRTSGTLDVTLSILTASGVLQTVAAKTGITATGLYKMTLDADFLTVPDAVPVPDQVVWDLVGDATAVSGTVEALFSHGS